MIGPFGVSNVLSVPIVKLASGLPITGPLLDVIHRPVFVFVSIRPYHVCCLAFFGFFRVAEFTCPSAFDSTTHLTATDVSIDPTSTIHLRLKSSKTDPFRQGFMIHIGASGKPICPVAVSRAYLDLRGHALGPLFVTSTLPATPVIVNHWSVPSSRPPAMVHPSAAIASRLGPPPQPQRRLSSRTTSSKRLAAGPATRTNATFVRLQTYGTCVMLIGWAAPF